MRSHNTVGATGDLDHRGHVPRRIGRLELIDVGLSAHRAVIDEERFEWKRRKKTKYQKKKKKKTEMTGYWQASGRPGQLRAHLRRLESDHFIGVHL